MGRGKGYTEVIQRLNANGFMMYDFRFYQLPNADCRLCIAYSTTSFVPARLSLVMTSMK